MKKRGCDLEDGVLCPAGGRRAEAGACSLCGLRGQPGIDLGDEDGTFWGGIRPSSTTCPLLPAHSPHPSCWTAHNLVSVGKREGEGGGGEGAGGSPGKTAMKGCGRALATRSLASGTPHWPRAEQPDSVQRPQGGVAGREGPRVHSDGEHSEASLESDRLPAGVLGRLRDHRPPNTSVDHTAGCRPLVGCEINLVVHSQHFKTD